MHRGQVRMYRRRRTVGRYANENEKHLYRSTECGGGADRPRSTVGPPGRSRLRGRKVTRVRRVGCINSVRRANRAPGVYQTFQLTARFKAFDRSSNLRESASGARLVNRAQT